MSEGYISPAIGSRNGPLQEGPGINQAAYSGYPSETAYEFYCR